MAKTLKELDARIGALHARIGEAEAEIESLQSIRSLVTETIPDLPPSVPFAPIVAAHNKAQRAKAESLMGGDSTEAPYSDAELTVLTDLAHAALERTGKGDKPAHCVWLGAALGDGRTGSRAPAVQVSIDKNNVVQYTFAPKGGVSVGVGKRAKKAGAAPKHQAIQTDDLSRLVRGAFEGVTLTADTRAEWLARAEAEASGEA